MDLRLGAEMKQEADVETTDPQIIQKLAFGDWREKLGSLHFDSDLLLYQKIHSKESDLGVAIHDVDRYFGSRVQPMTR